MPKKKTLTNERMLKGFKSILQYFKPYRGLIITLIGLSVASAILNAGTPYFAGKIIDSIIENPVATTLMIIGVWFGIRMIGEIVDWRLDMNRDRLGMMVYSDFLVEGYTKFLYLPMSFHKQQKMGNVSNRISRSANWIQNIAENVLIDLFPQMLSLIVVLGVTLSINMQLTGILFGAIILYAIITIRVAPKMVGIQMEMHKAYNRAYGDTYDAIFNIQAVKQSASEEYERKNIFKNFRRRTLELWMQYNQTWSLISFSQRVIIGLTQAGIFVGGILLISRGELSIGQLVMFNGYAAMVFGPFVRIAQNWQTIQNGVVALEQVQKVLNEPEEKYEPENTIILETLRGNIEFQNVGFAYKKNKNTLENINFEVKPGEVVALVGESGVGKSTLIDLISGYFFAKKGKVLIDGHNIKNLSLAFLRSQIAVVPQEIALFNDTVKNNIKYGKFGISDKKVIEAAQKAHAHEFIEKFPKKYNQVVGERGIKLSSGQKQRIAIARAVLRDPKILILDEPTSALDAQSEKFVTESLNELMKGRTTFIIAHRLSTVRQADRILVVDKGKIVEQGNHEELLKIENGIYHNLYSLQKL